MNGKPKQTLPGKTYNVHSCVRHHDLAILLKTARTQICNTCFATLKKSYFNVIAGSLLELHWLHNMTRGLVEQNNNLMARLEHQEKAILNLQAEITDIKNNGRDHEKPPTQPLQTQDPKPTSIQSQHPTSDPKIICPEGHVAKVAHSLQDLLHVQIARVLKSWKDKKDTTTP